MRITLHDIIHASAGPTRPHQRPAITDEVRAPWVKAMHGQLQRVGRDGGAFAVDFDVDVGLMRLRASRHGSALAAVWSVGGGDGDERVVAASVLLAGGAGGDGQRDADAAVAALTDRVPPFGDAVNAGALAQPRPCLATLYLDGRWYENARVELAATALALASMCGPEGRMSVRDAGAPRPAGADTLPATPFSVLRPDGLKFNFTRERLELVMHMVTKKGSAAIDRLAGPHFRVYPPREFIDRPGALRGRNIFDRLGDTSWCVRWYDGRLDSLSFGEFLGFVDQVAEVERAFREASGAERADSTAPQNSSVWGGTTPRPPGQRRPVRVGRKLDARRLVDDAHIRRLFAAVTLEPAPLATSPAT